MTKGLSILLFLIPLAFGLLLWMRLTTLGHRISRISFVPQEKSPTLMSTAMEEGTLHQFQSTNRVFSVVDLESSEDVANAIRKLDGTELKGKRIKLSEDPVRPPS